MPIPDLDQEKDLQEQESRINRQIAFASGLFQGDITIRTLLESLAEAVIIVDNSGTILLANTAAEKMFGYRKEDLVGKPHAVLLPERFRKVHEEHVTHYFAEPRIRPMGELLELYGLRQDGSEFPVEISLGFIETINGTLVLALVSDITLRKQFEARLRENEELFHIQVERVKDYAVFTLDPEGNVLNWNVGAERLKGYKAEEIIGKHFSCFFSEEDRNAGKPEEELQKAAAEGQVADEGWRIRKDGSGFWGDVVITALRDESGNLWGFSKVIHDITERKKAEEALSFSEARSRALFRDNPTMIFTLDTDLMIRSANQFCASELGYTIDELEGLSVLKLIHEDDRATVAEQLLECMRNPNQVRRRQFRKIRKDGGLLWVEEIAQAVYDLDGGPNVLVVCQDVTERKRAEEALRESEQRFASFMLYLPAAAWIKDIDGRYLYVNAEAERIFSRPMPAMQGKTDEEVFPPETARQFRENDERVLSEGGPVRTVEVLRQLDGIEHHSIVSKFAVPGPDGQPAYVAGVALDITETKRAEEALRKSEEKFSRIFQSVPALIAITTLAEGRCVDINERGLQTLGFQREEIIGRTMLELGVWESKSARDQMLRILEEKGMVRDLEINFRGKDGKSFIGLFSAEPIDFNGERYVLSIINDITDRKRMEKEITRLNTDLEAANKELEAFNYTVAHDLRQPLNLLNSYCQVIDKLCGDQLQEDCKEYVRKAYDSTLRMNGLIDALLNFSRMGHVEPHREMVDLCMLAHEVANGLKLTDPERQVDFRIADGIMANGEPNLLRVVLDNLLGNAWKFTKMRDKAIIEFGMRNIDGLPIYFVRDNGSGLDMTDAEKLFDPFQRLPGAEKYRGFGIGLATVERIIRRHGGKVWAEGEPGKGATFYFTLSIQKSCP